MANSYVISLGICNSVMANASVDWYKRVSQYLKQKQKKYTRRETKDKEKRD